MDRVDRYISLFLTLSFLLVLVLLRPNEREVYIPTKFRLQEEWIITIKYCRQPQKGAFSVQSFSDALVHRVRPDLTWKV